LVHNAQHAADGQVRAARLPCPATRGEWGPVAGEQEGPRPARLLRSGRMRERHRAHGANHREH